MAKPTEQHLKIAEGLAWDMEAEDAIAQALADEAECARLETIEEAARTVMLLDPADHVVDKAKFRVTMAITARLIRALAKPREDSNG